MSVNDCQLNRSDAMVSIESENMRGVTWCVVEEVESGDWGHRRQSPDHCRRTRAGARESRLRARSGASQHLISHRGLQSEPKKMAPVANDERHRKREFVSSRDRRNRPQVAEGCKRSWQ